MGLAWGRQLPGVLDPLVPADVALGRLRLKVGHNVLYSPCLSESATLDRGVDQASIVA